MIVKAKRRDILVRVPQSLAQKMDIALMCCSTLGTHVSRNRFIVQAIEKETDLIFQEMSRIQEEVRREREESRIQVISRKQRTRQKDALNKILNGGN